MLSLAAAFYWQTMCRVIVYSNTYSVTMMLHEEIRGQHFYAHPVNPV
jgi:hypothetical protein